MSLLRRSLCCAVVLATPAWGQALAAPMEAEAEATIDGPQYVIQIDAPSLKVAQTAAVQVKVKAKEGFKFNRAYPTKLNLADPPEGLELPKLKLKRADGTVGDGGKSFTFAVPVKAQRAGQFPLEGVLKFSVCSDSKCVVQRETLRTQITSK